MKIVREIQVLLTRSEGDTFVWTVPWIGINECPKTGDLFTLANKPWRVAERYATRDIRIETK